MASAGVIQLGSNVLARDYNAEIQAKQQEAGKLDAESERLRGVAATLAEAVSRLQNQINEIQGHIDESQKKHDDLVAEIAQNEILIQKNRNALGDILSEMYRELDAKPTVMDAIVNLNLRVHFDELRQLQDGFNQTFIQRSNAKNEGSKVVTQDVRLEAEVVITKLLKEIDLMQMKHSELDYNPLINNLNDTFTLFMSRAKTRTTIKKQFVAKSKVSPINTTTTAQNGNSGAVAVE